MGFAAPNQVTDATLANPGDTNPLVNRLLGIVAEPP
jgi:hypothetical protein